MNDWLSYGGVIGGLLAVGQFLYGIYKDRKGGALAKTAAEAAKASLDAEQAAAALPHVTEALALGNVQEAVGIMQGIINGLRDHAAWQDKELEACHTENASLRDRLSERDEKIAELEERLGEAEAALRAAARLIEELRETSRSEETRGAS